MSWTRFVRYAFTFAHTCIRKHKKNVALASIYRLYL